MVIQQLPSCKVCRQVFQQITGDGTTKPHQFHS